MCTEFKKYIMYVNCYYFIPDTINNYNSEFFHNSVLKIIQIKLHNHVKIIIIL